MSLKYGVVGWNPQKKSYDLLLAGGILLYLLFYMILGFVIHPDVTFETVLIRGLGTAALLLLHIILSIGPLARLNPKFLPLLYNRRHMGVSMFLLGLGHGLFSIIQFHALGDVNPIISVLTTGSQYQGLKAFPFQPAGMAALTVFFVMAATSHDFWLKNLTAPIWKLLHMLVYLAYALIIVHVLLGALQSETSPVQSGVLGFGMVWVLGLHLIAGWRERGKDKPLTGSILDGYIEVCDLSQIPEKCAHVAQVGGERIAIFKFGNQLAALSNVCQHQNGPLGEGRVVDGMVTCPWHGYQYNPEDGASPPPFTEKVPTFNLLVKGTKVLVDPTPNLPGTNGVTVYE